MSAKTIILFGSSGMLGTYVKKVLKEKYSIIAINREQFNISKDSWIFLEQLIINIKPNIIINCAGIIPQNSRLNNYNDYIRINTLFPHIVNNICKNNNIQFIHITTDCVFDGKRGKYDEYDIHTETGIYGTTKSLGEPEDATIIRTSIIGEELRNKNSLLEWVIKNKNKTIVGFQNHYWNGVTCLTLAKYILYIINTRCLWKGIRHIYSPDIVSKYELCNIINKVYKLNIEILGSDINSPIINKTLISKFKNDYFIDNIYNQIVELSHYKLV